MFFLTNREVLYLSPHFAEHLAGGKGLLGIGEPLRLVFLERRFDLRQLCRLEGTNPVGKGHGVMHSRQGTSTSGRVQLIVSRI